MDGGQDFVLPYGCGFIEAALAEAASMFSCALATSMGVPTLPPRFESPREDLRPMEDGHFGPPVGGCAKSASTGAWTVVARLVRGRRSH